MTDAIGHQDVEFTWQRRRSGPALGRLALFVVLAAIVNVAVLIALAVLVQGPTIDASYEPPPLRTRTSLSINRRQYQCTASR